MVEPGISYRAKFGSPYGVKNGVSNCEKHPTLAARTWGTVEFFFQ